MAIYNNDRDPNDEMWEKNQTGDSIGKVHRNNRPSAFVELKDFCAFSYNDEGHALEVTEWSNELGYDVEIHGPDGRVCVRLTHGQIDAINACIDEIQINR